MQAVEQKNPWKSRLIVSVAASTLVLFVGCTTPAGTAKIEPPASPIMPPTKEPSPVVEKAVIPPPPVLDLQPLAKEPTTGPKSYIVQPGDMLSKIARRAGVSVNELVALNHLKNANSIRVGQKLTLPGYAKDLPVGKVKESVAGKTSGSKKVVSSTAKKPSAEGGYEVQAGDALEKIARKFGVKVADLKAANNMTSDKIRVGQKLAIPGKGGEAAPVAPAADSGTPAPAADAGTPAPAVPAAPPTLLDYTVQDGETVDSVAKTFLVKKDDILKANGATDAAQIRPGMRIKIPVPAQ